MNEDKKDKDIELELKLMKYLANDKEKFNDFCKAVKNGEIEITGHNHDFPLSKNNIFVGDGPYAGSIRIRDEEGKIVYDDS